jgi:hypothetical protein
MVWPQKSHSGICQNGSPPMLQGLQPLYRPIWNVETLEVGDICVHGFIYLLIPRPDFCIIRLQVNVEIWRLRLA